MHYVYILKSRKNGEIYIGLTTDLLNRVKEHNAGLSKSTKRYRPWNLIYFEGYLSEIDAVKREHNLKYRGRAIAQLKIRIRESLNDTK